MTMRIPLLVGQKTGKGIDSEVIALPDPSLEGRGVRTAAFRKLAPKKESAMRCLFDNVHFRKCLAPMLAALLVIASAGATPARAEDGDAVALVNGHPIAREDLVKLLMESHGVDMLQQLIILQVTKQEARQRGLQVTSHDVDVEFQTSLDRIAEQSGMQPDEATDQLKRGALQQVLDERGISLAEFMIGMERNAYLRKIVEKDIQITEETLREQFARMYGERVVILHIQVPQNDSRTLNHAMELLARGSDFAEVARQLSVNTETAVRGGEMDPFTFDEANIPPAIRDTAFALKEGGVSSPVLAGQFFHILKLVRRIPADRARYEDKRDEVAKSVREKAVPQAMAKMAMDLFQQAKIKVLDEDLRAKYQQFLDRGGKEKTQP